MGEWEWVGYLYFWFFALHSLDMAATLALHSSSALLSSAVTSRPAWGSGCWKASLPWGISSPTGWHRAKMLKKTGIGSDVDSRGNVWRKRRWENALLFIRQETPVSSADMGIRGHVAGAIGWIRYHCSHLVTHKRGVLLYGADKK